MLFGFAIFLFIFLLSDMDECLCIFYELVAVLICRAYKITRMEKKHYCINYKLCKVAFQVYCVHYEVAVCVCVRLFIIRTVTLTESPHHHRIIHLL